MLSLATGTYMWHFKVGMSKGHVHNSRTDGWEESILAANLQLAIRITSSDPH